MAGILWTGSAGPQHAIYGIHRENLDERLTGRNWRRKAVMRADATGLVYLWIARGERKTGDSGKEIAYLVSAHCWHDAARENRYRAEFATLREALAYANGEDGGVLATETTAVGPAALACDEEAPIVFSFRPGLWEAAFGHRDK